MAGRRSFFSRLWEAITGGEKPQEIIPELSRETAPPPPPPREPEAPYVSESDNNERLANRLIRIFTRNQSARYRRRGINENRIRRNVDRMPQHVKDIAQRAEVDELLMYARYAEYTDDDGNNYFWYH